MGLTTRILLIHCLYVLLKSCSDRSRQGVTMPVPLIHAVASRAHQQHDIDALDIC